MIIKTGFPEYIESIAIGDDPSFLKENTDLCQTAIDFEAEINLAYLWKKIYTDPDTLDAVRDFTKNFLLDAPNLTTEHVLFYRNKIDQLPADIKEKLKEEVDNTFKKADNLSLRIKTTPSIERRFTRSVSIDNDKDFLQKIADLMNQCNSACNYFKNLSHRVGSIYDYSAVNTIHNSPPQDVDLNSPPPTGLTLEKVNKLPTKLWDCTSEAYTSLKVFSDKAKAAMHNFVSNYSLEKLGKKAQSSDEKGALYIGATSPSIFQETMEAYSKGVANNRMMFGDCFRLIDYMSRYNPFNPDMNIAKLIDKDIGIKTLEVVNGKYIERIIKVKPNGVNSRLNREKSYGLSSSPITYRGLHDELKKKKILKSNDQTQEEVREALDKYLEGSPLVTNFENLSPETKAQMASYGIVTGSKEEWSNFFMRLGNVESGFNQSNVSDINGFSPGQKGYNGNPTSYGVFQIGLAAGPGYKLNGGKSFTPEQLFDVNTNTQAAVKIWETNLYKSNYGFIKSSNGAGAGYFGKASMNKIKNDNSSRTYY
jgi:hypothetical protein